MNRLVIGMILFIVIVLYVVNHILDVVLKGIM